MYNHYLHTHLNVGKMRDSVLIFPRTILPKSSLVIRPSNTVSWTPVFGPSEWSANFFSHQGLLIVKSVKPGTATCLISCSPAVLIHLLNLRKLLQRHTTGLGSTLLITNFDNVIVLWIVLANFVQ